MIARKSLPEEFKEWNLRWKAPHGGLGFSRWPLRYSRFDLRRRGPFAWQSNNSTREFEYPWAYKAITKRSDKKLTIVDVGGSTGGMQFVLAVEGHTVYNIDPGMNAKGLGWDVDANQHEVLCRVFDAPVRLIPKTLEDAKLGDESADVILCISSLEHFSPSDEESFASEICRILKPGGLLVMTVDLFLDVTPFAKNKSNKWGRNIDIKVFLEKTRLQLVEGCTAELNGYEDFNTQDVLGSIGEYHVGKGYPCLAQCFVAKKQILN